MKKSKAAVFILLGQSNAVGHGIPMKTEDIISAPLKNVFGLSRADNQSFHNEKLNWSGYTSFGMNLAEEQDNTYSVANCLASLWQGKIDGGKSLPDLYIIQIAIGAQGVTKGYMWHPEREEKLIPGVLGKVDISLFPFTKHIFSLLDESLKDVDYEIIGLHWRGGENDTSAKAETLSAELLGIYERIFDEFFEILKNPPTVLHKIVCHERMEELGEGRIPNMHYINEVFASLQAKYENVSVFDPTTLPRFIPNVRGNGIFIDDAVHFTPEANRSVAGLILDNYIKSRDD